MRLSRTFGALDALHQDANPVSIVTSGLERVATAVFFASGKWRMVDRYRWWNDYRESTPVIIGHYWRWPTVAAREVYSRWEPDLFKECASSQWCGARKNVFASTSRWELDTRSAPPERRINFKGVAPLVRT